MQRGRCPGAIKSVGWWATAGERRISATGTPRPPARPAASAAKAKTTSELQSPTGYTGIYADWNVDLDGDGARDDPWGLRHHVRVSRPRLQQPEHCAGGPRGRHSDTGADSYTNADAYSYSDSHINTNAYSNAGSHSHARGDVRYGPGREILEAFYRATGGDNWDEQFGLAQRRAARTVARRNNGCSGARYTAYGSLPTG